MEKLKEYMNIWFERRKIKPVKPMPIIPSVLLAIRHVNVLSILDVLFLVLKYFLLVNFFLETKWYIQEFQGHYFWIHHGLKSIFIMKKLEMDKFKSCLI